MQTSEAQSILDYLVRVNLFIYSLDEEQQWYRYHHLFNDLLMARMCRTGKNQSNQLYSRASNWYEKNGDARLAVEYALKSQDISRAADLIEFHISGYWQTADLEFMFLINRLPEDEIIRRPSLCLHKAWVNVITGKMDQILPLVDAAENQLAGLNWKSRTDDEILRAFARILRIYISDFQNQSVDLDKSLAEAYGSIPESNSGMRNSVAIILGTIHYMENDFPTALRYYEDALECDKRLKGTNAIPISVLRIVWVLQKLGQLRQAMTLITKYERYVQQQGRRRFYIAGVLNLLMGEILYEWNRLDEAETQIREGLLLIKDWPSPSIIMVGYCLLTRLQIAQNNLPEARKTFLQVEELKHDNLFHPEFRNILEQTQLRLRIVEENWLEIEGFTRKKIPLVPFFSSFRYEAELLGLCRAWIALGHHQKAMDLLTRLSTSTGERKGSRLIILLLLAISSSKQPSLAEGYLEEALRMAEPEGYFRTFIDLGRPLWEILRIWFNHHQEINDESLRSHAYQILLAFETSTVMGTQPEKENDLPEPLTQREIEVLHLVAEGMTNQQIANQLVISVRTVKKHIENIHGKLGVQNRTQATTRARSLGLLDID
jgi:LuxR family maltose regulon positive regulatory protein